MTIETLLQRQVVCTAADCSVPERSGQCPAVTLSTFCQPLTTIPSSDSHSAADRAAISAQSWSLTTQLHAECPADHAHRATWRRSCKHCEAVDVATMTDYEHDGLLSTDPMSLATAPQACQTTQPTKHPPHLTRIKHRYSHDAHKIACSTLSLRTAK